MMVEPVAARFSFYQLHHRRTNAEAEIEPSSRSLLRGGRSGKSTHSQSPALNMNTTTITTLSGEDSDDHHDDDYDDSSSTSWGHLRQDHLCVQYVYRPGDAAALEGSTGRYPGRGQLKFMPCDETKNTQLWRFERHRTKKKDSSGRLDLTPDQYYVGLLFNGGGGGGGCLVVHGQVQERGHLRIVECDKNNTKQNWIMDGEGTLSPISKQESLCVDAKVHPVSNGDAVALLNCAGTHSTLQLN